MTAAAQQLSRLRCWWLAACCRHRLDQLDRLIRRIEDDLEQDRAVLRACHRERWRLAERLEATRLQQQQNQRLETTR